MVFCLKGYYKIHQMSIFDNFSNFCKKMKNLIFLKKIENLHFKNHAVRALRVFPAVTRLTVYRRY